jgi:hypothetical protein
MRRAKILSLLLIVAAFATPLLAKDKKKPAGVLVSWRDVPSLVQTTIQNGAAGGKIKETQKVTTANGSVYCAEVKGTDGKWTKVYATEAGTLLKVEPDNARNKRKHKPLFG